MAEKVKLTVNILDSEFEDLKRTAEAKGITLTDALRRSINLTSQIETLTGADRPTGPQRDLLLRGPDGHFERIIIP